jgi:hypothetical protein
MVRGLRKRHLQTWTALAALIPIGIISAVVVRPQLPKDKLLQPIATAALPLVLGSVDKENYTVRIRSNEDTSQLQLEWINKRTLTFPTAAIYFTTTDINDNDINNASLIGRIEARGDYYFLLANEKSKIQQFNKKYFKLILYDFIHQKVIETITF